MYKEEILLQTAISEKEKICKIVQELKSSIKQLPNGNLRIVTKGKNTEYYHITKKGDSLGKYLPKSQETLASQIIQKKYNQKVVVALEQEINTLTNFINHYKHDEKYKIYTKLSDQRKKLLIPLLPDKQTFIENWKHQKFTQKEPPIDQSFQTNNHQFVRSKSELIIANTLENLKIPYHYEFPVKITETKILHPDFFCLNPRTCQQFFWEHLGKMDDPVYTENVIYRLQLLSRKNIILGQNLIITMESKNHPLTTKIIEDTIQSFLL